MSQGKAVRELHFADGQLIKCGLPYKIPDQPNTLDETLALFYLLKHLHTFLSTINLACILAPSLQNFSLFLSRLFFFCFYPVYAIEKWLCNCVYSCWDCMMRIFTHICGGNFKNSKAMKKKNSNCGCSPGLLEFRQERFQWFLTK